MAQKAAIIGSGPAGFYAADALQVTIPGIEIDIIERLPTPFGLIRGGVAPDHQTTKKVAHKLEKTVINSNTAYFGNIEIGRDLTLAELRNLYDAVVLAVGAPSDRKLTIPGADKIGVHGSAAFVGWYNGHPDFVELQPDLNVDAAVVIGHGNVAIDVARLLTRSAAGRARTDLPDYARAAMDASPISQVTLLGRRGPSDAKFTNVELREMGELSECVPVLRAEQLPETVEGEFEGRDRRLRERNLATLKSFLDIDPAGRKKRVAFEFFARPLEVLGGERAEALRCERTRVVEGRAEGTGETFDIPCGLVVSAIGYRAEPIPSVPYDAQQGIVPNDRGRIEKGLYAVGWIKRGPTGVISSSRPDGVEAAEHIAADFPEPGNKPGRAGLSRLLAERGVKPVSFDDWKRLEAEEVSTARPPSPRRKFTDVAAMMKFLEESKR